MLTPDQIIDMAVDSGLSYRLILNTEPARLMSVNRLQKFAEQIAAAAAAAEREACAQVCEANSHPCREFIDQASICAAAIRACGEKGRA